MSYYTDMVSTAICIMETNIDQLITIKTICRELNITEFHFNRIFKAITGISPKRYIIGRKLTLAAKDLLSSDDSITNIALKWGFNYSEDFSRSFKTQYKVSPKEFRKTADGTNHELFLEPIKDLSHREFINKKGRVELKVSFKKYDEVILNGRAMIVSKVEGNYHADLNELCNSFLHKTEDNTFLEHKTFYSLVSCCHDENNEYDVYFGKKVIGDFEQINEMRVIPDGSYACFSYDGTVEQVYEDFEKDFYRWVIYNNIKLKDVGVNMITKYSVCDKKIYLDEIMIPVESPYTMEN